MKNNQQQYTITTIPEHLINFILKDYLSGTVRRFPHFGNVHLILENKDEKEYKHRQREKHYNNITLLIYVKNNISNINDIRKLFQLHLVERLKNKNNIKLKEDGTVSCLVPLYGSYKANTKLVEINNIILNNKDDYNFIKNFMSLSKERQSLYMNIIEESTDILNETENSMFKYKLNKDSLTYYIVKPDGTTQCIYKTNEWNKVLEIFEELLGSEYDINEMTLDEIIIRYQEVKYKTKQKINKN